MGNQNSDNSKENVFNFNTEPIKEKAGTWFKKFNFWGIFLAPFCIIVGWFKYLIGEYPSPFIVLINTLFEVYFQNITKNQSKFLVKTLNDEFSLIYNSIKVDLEKLINEIIIKDDIINKTKIQFKNN